ncbi:class I SAM-dependent methyltransferase [Desulfothermobacter acidiphilus]|uniref:class I SAM-dependent methyltransferase n=1 Tax=Desulfothermobacter acidiphilus TaxID=1938353 RepID=UPI003F886A0C
MRLNRVERFLVSHPARAWLLRLFYLGLLKRRLGMRLEGKKVLEVGCGAGAMTRLILELGADRVHAFDIDEGLVAIAQRRLAAYASRLKIYVADATKIPEPDASFDGVFAVGVLHHILDWRSALSEIARVLKPGGFYYFEEVPREGLESWFSRTFLEHPTEDRFTKEDFLAELEKLQLKQNLQVGTVGRIYFYGLSHKSLEE